MRAIESPKEVFRSIKKEWQELVRQEKLAETRFRQSSERFLLRPTRDNMDDLAHKAKEYSISRMKLKRFETEG